MSNIFILGFQPPCSYENLANSYYEGGYTNLEFLQADIRIRRKTVWSVPKNAEDGDFALFAVLKSCNDGNHLGKAIREAKLLGDDVIAAYGEFEKLLYQPYAGKIIAIGKIFIPLDDQVVEYNKNLVEAEIRELKAFAEPIATDSLKPEIKLSTFSSATKIKPEGIPKIIDIIYKSALV